MENRWHPLFIIQMQVWMYRFLFYVAIRVWLPVEASAHAGTNPVASAVTQYMLRRGKKPLSPACMMSLWIMTKECFYCIPCECVSNSCSWDGKPFFSKVFYLLIWYIKTVKRLSSFKRCDTEFEKNTENILQNQTKIYKFTKPNKYEDREGMSV